MSSLLPLPFPPPPQLLGTLASCAPIPCCDKAQTGSGGGKKKKLRAVWILIIAQHLFMRAGATLAEPPGDSAHAAGQPLSPLVRPSCFSRLSRSKPQHINNICSTPVQAPRERTHRSYHFFIREQVPHYPDLIGFGRLTPSTAHHPPPPPIPSSPRTCRTLLLFDIKSHLRQVIGRFKGQFLGFDVVVVHFPASIFHIFVAVTCVRARVSDLCHK